MERTQNFGSEALNSSSHSPTCLYVYPLTQLITTIIIYGESDLNPSCYNGKQSYQHRHQHKFKINLTGHPLKLISSSVPSFHECHYHIHNLSHVRLISPVTSHTKRLSIHRMSILPFRSIFTPTATILIQVFLSSLFYRTISSLVSPLLASFHSIALNQSDIPKAQL